MNPGSRGQGSIPSGRLSPLRRQTRVWRCLLGVFSIQARQRSPISDQSRRRRISRNRRRPSGTSLKCSRQRRESRTSDRNAASNWSKRSCLAFPCEENVNIAVYHVKQNPLPRLSFRQQHLASVHHYRRCEQVGISYAKHNNSSRLSLRKRPFTVAHFAGGKPACSMLSLVLSSLSLLRECLA